MSASPATGPFHVVIKRGKETFFLLVRTPDAPVSETVETKVAKLLGGEVRLLFEDIVLSPTASLRAQGVQNASIIVAVMKTEEGYEAAEYQDLDALAAKGG